MVKQPYYYCVAGQLCELRCGNGVWENDIVEGVWDEVCDDGNNVSGDGCPADCFGAIEEGYTCPTEGEAW